MSVHGMKPSFKDREGYLAWRKEWTDLYSLTSSRKRSLKIQVKNLQRQFEENGESYMTNPHWEALTNAQNELRMQRIMGRKLMTVLDEAKIRRDKIIAMHQGIKEQNSSFPLEISDARNIDFHFNKISLEFPFMPMWTLKAKGKSYYINHIDCVAPWTTRETPDNPTTKGSLRIRKGNITINEEGHATIS